MFIKEASHMTALGTKEWHCYSLMYKVVHLMYIIFFGFLTFVLFVLAWANLGWWVLAALLGALMFGRFLFRFLSVSRFLVKVEFEKRWISIRPLLALRSKKIEIKNIKKIEFIEYFDDFVLDRVTRGAAIFQMELDEKMKCGPIEFSMVFTTKDPYLRQPYCSGKYLCSTKTYDYQKDFIDVVMSWAK